MSGETNRSSPDQNDGVSGPSKQTHQPSETHAPPPLPVMPGELITEILLRLPVKSLLRFRCVSKQWNSMLSDTHFAKSHLYRSAVDPTLNHHRLLLPTETASQPNLVSCSVKSLFNNPLTPSEDLKLNLRPNRYKILGTCNGLVCLYDPEEEMHVRLCNPSMRLTSRGSPFMSYTFHRTIFYHGFGYDHVNDKYKVVLVFRDPTPYNPHRTVTKVYAFGNKAWTTIRNSSYLGYYPTNRSGKFVGGALNWVALAKGAGVANPSHVIHSFDLANETFGEVSLPDFNHDNPDNPIPAVLKDCLCVCFDWKQTHLVVWLMKEYGVKESWTKLMAIPHAQLLVSGFVPYIEPLCMSENGQVLLKTTNVRAVVYNPKDGRMEYPNIQSNKDWDAQYIYLESLVSPCF